MKTTMNVRVAIVAMVLLFGSLDGIAQGRGNARGHDRHPHKNSRDHDRYDYYSSRDWRGPAQDRYGRTYEYHRPPHWAPAHGYRNQVRYVYYRDHNVYYDCYRGVYISLSGRNWVFSQHIPVHMRRAPFERIAFVELDYYDDDLPDYLERRRAGGYRDFYSRR